MYGLQALDERITEVLEIVGLELQRRDLVRTFSRGMQQRLAIGRAVLHDPDVMLFDEPYTGLDQDASVMLDDILRSVAAQGRTIVMTSHDLVRAEDLATRFDILSHGVVTASASRMDKNVDVFFRDAVFTELRFVGINVNGGNLRLSGEIKEFLVDDLGFSVDWTLDVHYVVTNASTGAVVYDSEKVTKNNTSKFLNAFVSLDNQIKENIESLIKDPAFIKAIN